MSDITQLIEELVGNFSGLKIYHNHQLKILGYDDIEPIFLSGLVSHRSK